MIDRDNNRLYELDDAHLNGDGSWNAAGGAVFHLDSDNVRPTAQPGWTSADAAGLPIFPGLARYEEAALGPGGIRHALALHGAALAPRLGAAGVSFRIVEHEREPAADGHAGAAEGELRRSRRPSASRRGRCSRR